MRVVEEERKEVRSDAWNVVSVIGTEIIFLLPAPYLLVTHRCPDVLRAAYYLDIYNGESSGEVTQNQLIKQQGEPY